MAAEPRAAVVLDASIAVKWYLPEVLSDEALRLKRLIEERALPVGVPRIFFLETANVLWKKTSLTHELDPRDAKGIYSRILDTSFHIVQDDDILLAALETALRHRVSVYDGMYLASARVLGATFVTADTALVKRVSGKGFAGRVCFLGDFR